MLESFIGRCVLACVRHPVRVLVAALSLTLASLAYTVEHFAIDTDISKLVRERPEVVQRNLDMDAAFPARDDLTLVIVSAPAIELANAAASELAQALRGDQGLFKSVSEAGSGPFFEQQGLLYLSRPELDSTLHDLRQARPLLASLARDPSLRGLANLLAVTMQVPVQSGAVRLADMEGLLESSARVLDENLEGHDAALSWRDVAAHQAQVDGAAHAIIVVRPQRDYSELESGARASARVRALAAEGRLAERFSARVLLTGPIPLADEEFSSIQQGALVNGLGTLASVVFILWLALRSWRLIVAVLLTLLAGLAITGALGLMLVGALNMISVAFAVLFIGIGVDFSIQFGVRFRSERASSSEIAHCLVAAGRTLAMPLTLAACATAASFFAFMPTDYRGLAELGEIAGAGILLIAFPSAVTLLPALIVLLRPGPSLAAPGLPWLAPVDDYFARHRVPILASTALVIVLGAMSLPNLEFDFNPLHLKDPQSESVQSLRLLEKDPEGGVNDIQVLASDLAQAQQIAHALARLPQVGRTTTLLDLVPSDQEEKLKAIGALAQELAPVLHQARIAPATDAARIASLRNAAAALDDAADFAGDPVGAPAHHLARSLKRLASASVPSRDRAERALGLPLQLALASLARALEAQPISVQSLPGELRDQWLSKSGAALVDVAPHVPTGIDPGDDALLRDFAHAVEAAEPRAIGGPLSVLHSADTIVRSFFVASGWALVSIFVMLWLSLHRLGDVLRTLVPLLVSGLVTLELCVLFGIPLNFANIIALPLLLGIGVAFKIYYVVAWRNGQSGFLQSALTRAVVLSASTTATAFGSLWLSHHAGTASMGRLLALSLACTLVGAVLFQPVLMGKPRVANGPAPS